MSLVNSQRDLLATITDLEARLLKVERQLAVPRLARSFVATKQTTTSTSAVALTTADTLTVNTSSATVINFYVRATLENTGTFPPAWNSYVYIRDEAAATNYTVLSASGAGPNTVATVPGSMQGVGTAQLGGYVSLYVTTAGAQTFSLRYSVDTGTTGSFSNRLFLAEAQPF